MIYINAKQNTSTWEFYVDFYDICDLSVSITEDFPIRNQQV